MHYEIGLTEDRYVCVVRSEDHLAASSPLSQRSDQRAGYKRIVEMVLGLIDDKDVSVPLQQNWQDNGAPLAD